jgi:hypothetical protein
MGEGYGIPRVSFWNPSRVGRGYGIPRVSFWNPSRVGWEVMATGFHSGTQIRGEGQSQGFILTQKWEERRRLGLSV